MMMWQRIAVLYLPIVIAVCVWALRRPTPRAQTGALFAGLWLTHTLLAVNWLAIQWGWWRFTAATGTFADIPADLLLGWIILWAILPTILLPSQPLWRIVLFLLTADLLLMPRLAPLLILETGWWWGELLLLTVAYIPAHWLARWTRDDHHLYARVGLLVITFSALIVLLLPGIILSVTGTGIQTIYGAGLVPRFVLVSLLVVVGSVGLSAVQAFAVEGMGTPVPLDPPRHLVTSGVYAYMSNPMQMTLPAIYALFGLCFWNGWLLLAAVGALAYGMGLATVSESADMSARFGEHWQHYRQQVRPWRIRWRPIILQPATLYVAGGCTACSQVRQWFAHRRPTNLILRPAPAHLRRITYVTADGHTYTGIRAIAHAFNHIHLGYAWLGWLIALPGIADIIQLANDIAGGDERTMTAP